MAVEVFMPKMSDNMEVGEIVEWLVQEGKPVEKGEPILVVLTDKATVEVEAPATGILKGIPARMGPGANIPVGEILGYIVKEGEDVPTLPAVDRISLATKAEAKSGVQLPEGSLLSANEAKQLRATPVVRRLAKDMGIDLSQVKGTGPEGRITQNDLLVYAEKQKKASRFSELIVPGSQPASVLSENGPETWIELTAVQRLTGQRMVQSLQNSPQFSLTVQVDMTDALNLLDTLKRSIAQESGENLSITAILVKAVALVLKEMPRVNASWVDGRIKAHSQVNIGVAVGSEAGLFVPVIKDADKKSLAQIDRDLKSFQEKAAQMNFQVDDLGGSTFTISNLGMHGIDSFHALINPPESAILAVGRIIKTPVVLPGDVIAARPMMTLTLSVDHRVLDGIQGANFLTAIREILEQPVRLN